MIPPKLPGASAMWQMSRTQVIQTAQFFAYSLGGCIPAEIIHAPVRYRPMKSSFEGRLKGDFAPHGHHPFNIDTNNRRRKQHE